MSTLPTLTTLPHLHNHSSKYSFIRYIKNNLNNLTNLCKLLTDFESIGTLTYTVCHLDVHMMTERTLKVI